MKTRMELPPKQLGAVLSSMGEGLIVADKTSRVVALNQAGGVLLRLAPMQALGTKIGDVFSLFRMDDMHSEEKWPIEEVIAKADIVRIGVWDKIYCRNRIGQVFPIALVIAPLLDDGVTGAVVLFRDATEEARIDKAKSEFVSLASHQLHTPLTAIRLFVEMLAHEEVGPLNTDQKEYLTYVYESAERMVQLVNELLNVSRLEAGGLAIEPQSINLADFVNSLVSELRPLAKVRSFEIEYQNPLEDWPNIPIDAGLARQVISNLIDNAIRYSPASAARVIVELRLDEGSGEYIVSVTDQGIGIKPEDAGRMFQKFFRADNAKKAQSSGSGLGLYVAKMIVATWGGRIWFNSQPGKGTTFYMSIPKQGMKAKAGERKLEPIKWHSNDYQGKS